MIWTSSDKSIAVVNDNGEVIALQDGEVVISASRKNSPFGFISKNDLASQVSFNIEISGSSAIYFESKNSFTVSSPCAKTWDGVIQYSFNDSDWLEWNGSDILSAEQVSDTYIILLRVLNNTYITGYSADKSKRWVIDGSDVYCGGDTRNLLNYEVTLI